MPTRYLEYIHPQSAFARWAWGPAIVLRVSLVIIYGLYAYGALIAFLVGVPIFDLTTPQGWTPVWAVLLGVSALVCMIGSIKDEWQRTERWAALGLSAAILAYIVPLHLVGYLEGDLSRQFIAVIATIAGVLPIGRFVYLVAQTGKRKHHVPGRV